MERPDDRNSRQQGTAPRLWSALQQTLSDDPHLTDVELIELSAGVIGAEAALRLWAHTRNCPKCTAEIERLSSQTAAWNDPREIERREARIGRHRSPQERTERPWWAAAAQWVSIAALRPQLSALAAGDDVSVVPFSVTDGRKIVADLSGAIRRGDNVYHVRITSTPEIKEAYVGRMVEVVLADRNTEDVLSRRVPMDQWDLLGTDLDIATKSIAARLLP